MKCDDLSARVDAVTARAMVSGALVPMTTEIGVVEDEGIPYLVHVLTRLGEKREAGLRQQAEGFNPFLPPDPELTVCEAGPQHLCVLNKFNVIDRHLLIITRRFEPQTEWLSLADFEALSIVMKQFGGLAFYNAGTVAGASQEHKHLQLVPTPLGGLEVATPADVVIGDLKAGSIVRRPRLGFTHVLARPGDLSDAEELSALYRRLCTEVGVTTRAQPYNLLLTEGWMMVVPRSAEFFESMSVNALGFAGSLLVKDHSGLERIRETGPRRVLEAVTRV